MDRRLHRLLPTIWSPARASLPVFLRVLSAPRQIQTGFAILGPERPRGALRIHGTKLFPLFLSTRPRPMVTKAPIRAYDIVHLPLLAAGVRILRRSLLVWLLLNQILLSGFDIPTLLRCTRHAGLLLRAESRGLYLSP